MVQEISNKAWQAEARTEETKSFIRQVKRITRRKFTPEEKIRIVLKGFRHEVPVRELCRREGIRPNVYYAWLKDFMEAGKERLQHDAARDATRAEVQELKRENLRLKQLVAELLLQVYVLKKTAVPGHSLPPINFRREIELSLLDLKENLPGFDRYAEILRVDCFHGDWPIWHAWPGYDLSQKTSVENLYNVGDGVRPSGQTGTDAPARSAQIVVEDIKRRIKPDQ